MDGSIIAFRLFKKTDQREINQFCKKFYGQDTSSHKKKYKYRRKGLLDNIPHRKLIRGVLITLDEYAKTIINFLKEYNAEYYIRKIELTSDDENVLLQENK